MIKVIDYCHLHFFLRYTSKGTSVYAIMTAKAAVVKLMAPKASTATKVENTINADFRDFTHKIYVQSVFSERVRETSDFKSHIYLLTKIRVDLLTVIQKNLNEYV